MTFTFLCQLQEYLALNIRTVCLFLVEDKTKWLVLAKVVIYFWIPQTAENFVTGKISASEQRLFCVVVVIIVVIIIIIIII